MNDTITRVRYEGRNRSHAFLYMILIKVSYAGDYEHPYYSFANNEGYGDEEATEEEFPLSDV